MAAALLASSRSSSRVVLIFLVLMHSGKDAGLSGAFGVGSGRARSAAARWSSAT